MGFKKPKYKPSLVFSEQSGFSLIELMVVVSIISLISSIVVVQTAEARRRGRDSVRKQTIINIQKALETYFSTKGIYPTSAFTWNSSEPGDGSYHGPDWIPGLVPKYMSKLPRDPLGGQSPLCGTGYTRGYLYVVEPDGRDYKILSHCASESGYTPNDPLNDQERDGGPDAYTPPPAVPDPHDPTQCDGAGDGTGYWAWSLNSSTRSRCW